MVRPSIAAARTRTFWIFMLIVLAGTLGCMGRPPARAAASSAAQAREVREGLASYYGRDFHGKQAASGVRFDMNALVAAHPDWPFGTVVRVTHLESGRTVRVRIVDRGPAAGPRREGVIIDLSRAAARTLGFIEDGRARVRLEVLSWGADS